LVISIELLERQQKGILKTRKGSRDYILEILIDLLGRQQKVLNNIGTFLYHIK
jgi:hypothetical protein